jgi:Leucine-rich repeat (LRR) protein
MGDFDEALANAATETSLHFTYGRDGYLDGRIAQFQNLEELQLREVPPECVLPDELLALPKLRTLGLSGENDKLVVPALVGKLGITRLDVWDCHASELPPLPRVTHLEIVVKDPLTEVAILAERFSHLTHLEVWGSHLEKGELPVDIERFGRLETLELVSCGVSVLPDAIAKLDSLRAFEIRGCPMSVFPEVLTRMPKLAAIRIGTQITGLPASLGQMTGLRELGLRNALNKGAMLSRWDDTKTIKALPKVIGELVGLEKLDLDCCGVFDVEPLRTLRGLRSLSLSWSAISTVEPLGDLVELEELSLEHADRVKDFSPLAKCKKLRKLDISNTKPKSLDFLRELPALKELNVDSIEAKRIDAIYDLEVTLEADDDVKERYAARAALRQLPSIAQITEMLESREFSVVQAACDHLATWAAASSTKDENALVAALGIPKFRYSWDYDDDEDDDDDDDDDDDEDEDDDNDDVEKVRAGGSLPALDTALDRYLASLSGTVLAKLFGVVFHSTSDNFPAALRIANELVSREDHVAQCAMIDGFIAASEHYDSGHREHMNTVHDVMIDDVMPLLGGPALAKILAWADSDALDTETGDRLGLLFAPALQRASGPDLEAVIERLEKYSEHLARYKTERVEPLLASFVDVSAEAQVALAAMRSRLDAQLAEKQRRADLEKRLADEATATAAIGELATISTETLKELQGTMWDVNEHVGLPPEARRDVLRAWERLDYEMGFADAIMHFSGYVPVDELRADLDVLAVTNAERGKLVREAVLRGIHENVAKDRLDKLRAIATALDDMPRTVADSSEVQALLFGSAARFESEKFTSGIAALASLPAYTPADREREKPSELASMVAHLAECSEFEPLQQLARSLHKLQLSGKSLERILAQLVAVCMIGNDPEGLRAVLPLVPAEVTWDILAFNLACKYAREADREGAFKFTKRALELGKSPDQFLSDTDFEDFAEDREFVALLDSFR